MPENNRLSYIKSLSKLFFYFFMGLSLFFISAFVIISVRVSDKGSIIVPDVMGNIYLEVHNKLTKNFKVILERKHSLDYPMGYILNQNLSPGEKVSLKSKLVLTINQSMTVIQTPNLVGKSLDLVSDMLKKNIHKGNRTFRLKKGTITKIQSNSKKGIVLDQYPPANVPVIPGSSISLLVSSGKTKATSGKKKVYNIPSLKGVHIEIAKYIAYYFKVPLKITTRKTKDLSKDGIVYYTDNIGTSIQRDKSQKPWQLSVNRWQEDEADQSEIDNDQPFRLVWLKNKLPKGRFTIAREARIIIAPEGVQHNIDGIKKYSDPAYLIVENEVPYFRYKDDSLVYWQGYESNVHKRVLKPIEVEAKEDQSQIFKQEQASKKPTKRTPSGSITI